MKKSKSELLFEEKRKKIREQTKRYKLILQDASASQEEFDRANRFLGSRGKTFTEAQTLGILPKNKATFKVIDRSKTGISYVPPSPIPESKAQKDQEYDSLTDWMLDGDLFYGDLDDGLEVDLSTAPNSSSHSSSGVKRKASPVQEQGRPPPKFGVGEYVYAGAGAEQQNVQAIIKKIIDISAVSQALDQYEVFFTSGRSKGELETFVGMNLSKVPKDKRIFWIDRAAAFGLSSGNQPPDEAEIDLIPADEPISDFILAQNDQGQLRKNKMFPSRDELERMADLTAPGFSSNYDRANNPKNILDVVKKYFGQSQVAIARKVNKKVREPANPTTNSWYGAPKQYERPYQQLQKERAFQNDSRKAGEAETVEVYPSQQMDQEIRLAQFKQLVDSQKRQGKGSRLKVGEIMELVSKRAPKLSPTMLNPTGLEMAPGGSVPTMGLPSPQVEVDIEAREADRLLRLASQVTTIEQLDAYALEMYDVFGM